MFIFKNRKWQKWSLLAFHANDNNICDKLSYISDNAVFSLRYWYWMIWTHVNLVNLNNNLNVRFLLRSILISLHLINLIDMVEIRKSFSTRQWFYFDITFIWNFIRFWLFNVNFHCYYRLVAILLTALYYLPIFESLYLFSHFLHSKVLDIYID